MSPSCRTDSSKVVAGSFASDEGVSVASGDGFRVAKAPLSHNRWLSVRQAFSQGLKPGAGKPPDDIPCLLRVSVFRAAVIIFHVVEILRQFRAIVGVITNPVPVGVLKPR